MANVTESLGHLMQLQGAIGAAIVDLKSGITLAYVGGNPDIEIEAATNADIFKAKRYALQALGKKDSVEDFCITTARAYDVMCVLQNAPETMIYLQLNRLQANLGLTRHVLTRVGRELSV